MEIIRKIYSNEQGPLFTLPDSTIEIQTENKIRTGKGTVPTSLEN